MTQISIKRGQALQLTLAFANADGTAFDLTSVVIWGEVRDPRGVLVWQLTLEPTGTPGMATITVADTSKSPVGLLAADLLIWNAGLPTPTESFGILVRQAVTYTRPAGALYDPVTGAGGAAAITAAPPTPPTDGSPVALPAQITITQNGISPPVIMADGSVTPPAVAEFFTNLVVGDFLLAATVSGGMGVAQSAGGCVPADASTLAGAQAFIGVAQQGGNAGGSIAVVSYGPVADTGWAWTPYQPIFLGTAGALTQTPPASGISLIVGFAISATEIFVRPLSYFQL